MIYISRPFFFKFRSLKSRTCINLTRIWIMFPVCLQVSPTVPFYRGKNHLCLQILQISKVCMGKQCLLRGWWVGERKGTKHGTDSTVRIPQPFERQQHMLSFNNIYSKSEANKTVKPKQAKCFKENRTVRRRKKRRRTREEDGGRRGGWERTTFTHQHRGVYWLTLPCSLQIPQDAVTKPQDAESSFHTVH